ncbi:MAG: DUF4133 domain-containing protein [Sphingobacteriales bacterium]|nr:MAG: DUF4133 domain-containing protein [Sphingobacteriales bacterium]
MGAVFQINKGVARPIMFKGLKGQYIACLGIGMVVLLLLFAVLYMLRVNVYLVLVLISALALGLVLGLGYLSGRFGQYGLMKFFAARQVPSNIRFRSRRLFTALKHVDNELAVKERRHAW